MAKIRTRAVVPQGMIAPSGYAQTEVDPAVQSTARPPGSLLAPSPGYETVREGKNEFQSGGKGMTGGFKPFEYAEDIGGSGAALSITPGDTSTIENTQWLPTDEGDIDEGSVIISDRVPKKRFSVILHEAEKVLPDFGDRSPGRPRSRSMLFNPITLFREDYKENKVATVLAAVGVVVITYMIGNDLEREYGSRRGKGVASGVEAAPTATAATGEDVLDKTTKAIGETVDGALKAIEKAADSAVGVIENVTPKGD
jgi:hypothetical protein